MQDRPLYRGCTAVVREERCVQVQTTRARRVEHTLRKDPSISQHDGDISVECTQPSFELAIANLVRLVHRDAQLLRSELHCRSSQGQAAAFGAIGLANHPNQLTALMQRLQRGDRDGWRTEENAAHELLIIGAWLECHGFEALTALSRTVSSKVPPLERNAQRVNRLRDRCLVQLAIGGLAIPRICA
jgi:hypothetical protein